MATAVPILPDELISEIISWLHVKILIRFRCVNKFFKTLISDPHFVQIHLKKSARNPRLTLPLLQIFNNKRVYYNVVTFPISRLLENPPTIICVDAYCQLTEKHHDWWVIGSCNGLLCLIDRNSSSFSRDILFGFWNPTTRTKSEYFLASPNKSFLFTFGYDTLTKTYKVVAFRRELDVEHGNAKMELKIFSMGNNSWRNIQCAPVLPLYRSINHGVYLSGTINWLALRDYFGSIGFCFYYESITIEQFVILSLDLSTETYTQLLLPPTFDKVPRYEPKLVVLMDYLCFCHDFEETHFIIWQMKDFGVHESWIQLLKITYYNSFSAMELKLGLELFPLYLSENGDKLILGNVDKKEAFIYSCRDNRVEKIGISDKIFWSSARIYIESFVSTD